MEKHHIPQLLEQATAAGTIIWAKYVALFPKLKGKSMPVIVINNRLKTCGGRIWTERRHCELSAEMFFYNQEEYYKQIIPHEFAHQVDWDLFKGHGHGPSWKGVMVAYGIPPDRLHNMINPLHVKRQQARMKA